MQTERERRERIAGVISAIDGVMGYDPPGVRSRRLTQDEATVLAGCASRIGDGRGDAVEVDAAVAEAVPILDRLEKQADEAFKRYREVRAEIDATRTTADRIAAIEAAKVEDLGPYCLDELAHPRDWHSPYVRHIPYEADEFDALGLDDLKARVAAEDFDAVAKTLWAGPLQAEALRWRLRGLRVDYAVLLAYRNGGRLDDEAWKLAQDAERREVGRRQAESWSQWMEVVR